MGLRGVCENDVAAHEQGQETEAVPLGVPVWHCDHRLRHSSKLILLLLLLLCRVFFSCVEQCIYQGKIQWRAPLDLFSALFSAPLGFFLPLPAVGKCCNIIRYVMLPDVA